MASAASIFSLCTMFCSLFPKKPRTLASSKAIEQTLDLENADTATQTKNRNGTVLRKIKSIGSKATSLLKSAPKEVANLTHAARGSTNSTRIPKTSLILNKARRLDHHDRSDSVQPVTLLPTPKPPVKAVNYLGHLPQHDLVRGLVDHGICTQSAGDAFLAKSQVSVNTFEPALNLDDKDPDEDKLFSTIDESHLSLETTYDDIRNLICRGALPGAARNAYLFQAPPISPGFNDTSLQTSSDKISYSLDPEPAPLYPLVDDLVAIPAVSSLLSATQPPPPSFRLTNQQSRFVEHFNLDAPFQTNPIAESLGSQPEAQQTARLHHTPQKCLGKQTREEVLVGLISHDLISKAAGKPHFPHTRTLADSSPAHSSSKTFHVFNSHPFTSIPTLCSLRNADLVDSLGVSALPSPTPVDHPTPWLNVAEYLRNQTMKQMVGELIHHGIVCRTARHIYPGLQLATSHRYPGLLTRRSSVASSKSSFFFQSEPAKDIDSHERSGGSASLTSPHTPVSAVLPEVKTRFFEDFRIDADEDVSPIPTATHDEAYKVSRRSPPKNIARFYSHLGKVASEIRRTPARRSQRSSPSASSEDHVDGPYLVGEKGNDLYRSTTASGMYIEGLENAMADSQLSSIVGRRVKRSGRGGGATNCMSRFDRVRIREVSTAPCLPAEWVSSTITQIDEESWISSGQLRGF